MMTMLLGLVIVNKSFYLSPMSELNVILVLVIQNTDFSWQYHYFSLHIAVS